MEKSGSQTPDTVTLQVIGHVECERRDLGDDFWGDVESRLHLNAFLLGPDSFDGIENFSHLEVILHMHLVSPAMIPTGARHPRNLAHLPRVGIMAQRPKARPNRIGLSRCALVRREGHIIHVRGLDAVDGTPILDIKPWFHAFGPTGSVNEPQWVFEITRDYYKCKP